MSAHHSRIKINLAPAKLLAFQGIAAIRTMKDAWHTGREKGLAALAALDLRIVGVAASANDAGPVDLEAVSLGADLHVKIPGCHRKIDAVG